MAQGACNDSEAMRHALLMYYNTLRFSKCLQVNSDRDLVVVTIALEKYLLEADVASYTNIFSSHLWKQRQLLIRSFPFSRHFSG